VSDANLVLGYLNPDYFLGGSIPLRADLARAAIARLGDELGLSVEETAWGIHRVVNENMAAAARVHIIERNRDPRALTTIAFGGAGPAHAVAVARILGSPAVIFPPGAGVASAFGALVAPLSFTAGRTLMTRLDRADWDEIGAIYDAMRDEAFHELSQAGVDPATIQTRRWAEMRLEGQYHEIAVDLTDGPLGPASIPNIQTAFDAAYARQYGRVLEGLPIEVLHWRMSATGPEQQVALRRHERQGSDAATAIKAHRDVWFPGGYRQTTIYDRDKLASGMTFDGPAIIEEREATAVIWPGDRASVDEYLAIIVEIGRQEQPA
ncbi:MAG TPA: hydantoinase/oxoprolinase family protein, partial [Thermomicrobiales bacterium]|nr:hydantoinase/oxoprolinase family protein [Thermomicrobiales bacterium]